MLNKISLLMVSALLLGTSYVYAMPREAEHAACLKKATTDTEVTKCRETQIDAVKAVLAQDENKLRNAPLLQGLVSSSDNNIEAMRSYFEKYSKSHCLYYVMAHSGNGYSDEFNKAKCELANILQYDGNLQSVHHMVASDIRGQ